MLLPEIWKLVCGFLNNGALVYLEIYPTATKLELAKLMSQTIYDVLESEFFTGPGVLNIGMSCMQEFCLMLQFSEAVIGGSFVASLLTDNLSDQSDIDIFAPTNKPCIREWLYLFHEQMHMNNKQDYHSCNIAQCFEISNFRRHFPNDQWAQEDRERRKAMNQKGYKLIWETAKIRKMAELSGTLEFVNMVPTRSTRLSRTVQLVELKEENVVNYLSFDSDIDLFKTFWNGEMIFGSLVPNFQRANSEQAPMPHHSDFFDFCKALKLRNLNFRMNTTMRSIERLSKWSGCNEFDKRKWNFQLDAEGAQGDLLTKKSIIGENGILSFSMVPYLTKACNFGYCEFRLLGTHQHSNINGWNITIQFPSNE